MPKIQISIEEWYKLPASEKDKYVYITDVLGRYFMYKTESYRKATGDGYIEPEETDDFDELQKLKGGEK